MSDTMIKVCGLYENTSQKTGKTYFVGYAGSAKYLILPERDPKTGEPTWSLLITENPPRERRADADTVTGEAVPA